MRIDIEKVLEQGGMVDATIPPGPLEWEDSSAIASGPTTLRGRIARGTRGYDFDAQLSGGVTLNCVRCLEPFHLDLAFGFHLLFVRSDVPSRAGESKIQNADCDLYPSPDGKVDLEAVAREQIYLQLPLKPICSASCRGLCKTCGENLNRGACQCQQPEAVRVV